MVLLGFVCDIKKVERFGRAGLHGKRAAIDAESGRVRDFMHRCDRGACEHAPYGAGRSAVGWWGLVETVRDAPDLGETRPGLSGANQSGGPI